MLPFLLQVENLNSKWQKYDLSREEYVRGLCQKLKEANGGTSAGTMNLYQQEINRLNGLLEEKMRECDRLSRDTDDRMQRNKERIQMLEQQVIRKTCFLYKFCSFHVI